MRYTNPHNHFKKEDVPVKRRHYPGIRFKIILSAALCVVVVGLASNMFLYQYMQRIISDKLSQIDDLNANTINAQVDDNLNLVATLGSYCSNSSSVISALSQTDLGSVRTALQAQDDLNTYLRTLPISNYINKLMVFNNCGIWINAVTVYDGTLLDYSNIWNSEQFRVWRFETYSPFSTLYPSLHPQGPKCFALFFEVYSQVSALPIGYVYIELDPSLISDVLIPYNDLNLFFVQTPAGIIPTTQTEDFSESLTSIEQGASFYHDGVLYAIQNYPLRTAPLVLSICINQTQLQANNHDILFSVFIVIWMIVLIAVFILALLTHYITIPIKRIIEKINRIALNDYSFDPQLEDTNSELGEIGARLNELGVSFERLLSETIALHEERTRIEMDLLQSQVNPHFLYNTLNSVHWMAVVNKNTGIEKIVKSLVSLLKNISKGVSDKITLSDELSLLEDYISIQSIRYMGAFEYVCKVPEELRQYRVIKFTLQPLVENAIFHGIVPKGTFGVVTVDAFEEGDFLVITITDDGMGMTEETVATLLHPKESGNRSSMVGIGIANVHRRLKLSYGKGSGLSVESVLGQYTKVYVRIRKELWKDDKADEAASD